MQTDGAMSLETNSWLILSLYPTLLLEHWCEDGNKLKGWKIKYQIIKLDLVLCELKK